MENTVNTANFLLNTQSIFGNLMCDVVDARVLCRGSLFIKSLEYFFEVIPFDTLHSHHHINILNLLLHSFKFVSSVECKSNSFQVESKSLTFTIFNITFLLFMSYCSFSSSLPMTDGIATQLFHIRLLKYVEIQPVAK